MIIFAYNSNIIFKGLQKHCHKGSVLNKTHSGVLVAHTLYNDMSLRNVNNNVKFNTLRFYLSFMDDKNPCSAR